MPEPLFIKFSNTLKQKILSNEYQYGDKLPTEEELAEQYSINRKTIRKAKKLLISEGILITVRGKGTFINRPPLRYDQRDMGNSFSSRSQSLGHSSSKVLFAGPVEAGNLCRIFKSDKESKLYRLLRIRYLDGIPFAVENAFFPVDLIPNIEKYDFSIHSLYAAMEEYGISFAKDETRLNVVTPTSDIANALNLPQDTGVFKIEFFNYDKEDKLIEYTQFYGNDDKVDIIVR